LGTYSFLQGEIDAMWNCYLPEAFQPLILVAFMAYNKHIFHQPDQIGEPVKNFLNFYAACLYKAVYFALGKYPS
jgi:hypothetical protein